MALDTDLSRKPYFDDYDVTKNFYRVLYRPAAAVQARELNQMQTIMQDQIDKFGRHIFKEGSVVEGCAFTFDNSYNYVKIKDNYANNSAISNINDFVGRIAINTNGLQARIVNALGGYESEDPNLNTLYLKYLNSTVFANGSQQTVFANNENVQIQTDSAVNIGNVVVATVANSTGKGYAFTTTEGVIFKKGFFIRVEPQTLVVARYDNIPDGISVGFEANELIITPQIDTSLLDNAAGSPNYDAPGAHRLKLIPTLVTRSSNSISNTTTFFSLCDFKNGLPVSIKNDPQYAAIAKDTARRTFETNGDYIVNPFLLNTQKKYNYTSNTANSTYLSIVSSPGIGYVKGYRVEFINNNTTDLRKAFDYDTVTNQIVTANFGYYLNVDQFVGDFNNDQLSQVELHNVAKTAISKKILSGITYIGTAAIGYSNTDLITISNGLVNATANVTTNSTGGSLTFAVTNAGLFSSKTGSSDVSITITANTGLPSNGTGATFLATLTSSPGALLSTSYSSSTKIGTAYVRGVAYDSGTPGFDATYTLYIFNIKMLPGQKLQDARSAIYYDGSLKAVCDIILDKDFSGANVAKIQESLGETLIYAFGQKAIRPEGFSNTAQYVYRNRATPTPTFVAVAGGSLSLTLPAACTTNIETFNYGVGVLSQSSESSFMIIPTATGYTTSKTGNVSVNTTSTSVIGSSTLFLSDYRVGDYFYCNTATKLINSIVNNSLMIVDSPFAFISSSVSHQKTFPAGVPISFQSPNRTINITSSTTANISLGEVCNADFSASVYFDTLRSATIPIGKKIQKSTYIKIKVSNNQGGTTGPWCLGIPDVLKLNSVYVDQTGNTYSIINPDKATSFRLDNGQRDGYYDLAYLSATSPVSSNATLLISVDNFVADTSQGVGFFTAASYPIDDANTANTQAIRTYEIPQYNSTTGILYDLRDSVDFRPYATNTAVANASSVEAALPINPSNTLTLYTYGLNGSYIPTPGTNYQSKIDYYLPRKDRISLTTGGNILITEGVANLYPAPPPEVPGTMTIGITTVAPYPSLTPTEARTFNRYDYAVQTSIMQTKRYTMADINKINKRIDRLEYYTSLSLLEQATSSLLVRSDATGQNRFKNGILVDPFKNHTIGNTNDPAYRIAIDEIKTEARPYFRQQTVSMQFDPVASTAVNKNGVIMLPHTSNNINQQQLYASKIRNCIEGNIYNYRGTVTLDPQGILDSDITQGPVINSNLDLSSNFINLANSLRSMFGTKYGNWTDYGASQVVGSDNNVALTSIGYGTGHGQFQNWQSTTTTTLAQQQQQINQSFAFQSTETNVELGNYVTNVSVQPYVPARQVFFYARGMKPNTKLYVFLDSVIMNQDCLPLTPYSGTLFPSGGNNFTDAGKLVYISRNNGNFQFNSILDWGNALYSNDKGIAYGIIAIPSGLFKSGELEFRITDISDLTVGENVVTTQSSTTLFCSALSVQKSRSVLQVKAGTINVEEEKLNRTVQQTQTSTNTWKSFDPNIANPHCPPENAPLSISQVSGDLDPGIDARFRASGQTWEQFAANVDNFR